MNITGGVRADPRRALLGLRVHAEAARPRLLARPEPARRRVPVQPAHRARRDRRQLRRVAAGRGPGAVRRQAPQPRPGDDPHRDRRRSSPAAATPSTGSASPNASRSASSSASCSCSPASSSRSRSSARSGSRSPRSCSAAPARARAGRAAAARRPRTAIRPAPVRRRGRSGATRPADAPAGPRPVPCRRCATGRLARSAPLTVIVAASGFGMLGPLSRFAYDAGMEPLSFVAWRATFGLLVRPRRDLALGRGAASRSSTRGGCRASRPDRPRGVAALTAFGLNLAMFIAFDLTRSRSRCSRFYTYPALVAVVAVALGHERLDRHAGRRPGPGRRRDGRSSSPRQLDPSGGGVTIHPLGVAARAGRGGLAGRLRDGQPGPASRRSRPSRRWAWAIGATAVACAIATAAAGGPLGVRARPARRPGRSLAFTGLFAAAIPSILFLTGIRAIGGTRAGILMLFEPVVGVRWPRCCSTRR